MIANVECLVEWRNECKKRILHKGNETQKKITEKIGSEKHLLKSVECDKGES